MKYIFYGNPNQLVKSRHKVLFENRVDFKPLFRFNDKGEYITDDEKLIEKLKSRFDHKPYIEETILSEGKSEVDNLPSKEKEAPQNENKSEIFKCKKCDFKGTSKGQLLAHYKKCKG